MRFCDHVVIARDYPVRRPHGLQGVLACEGDIMNVIIDHTVFNFLLLDRVGGVSVVLPASLLYEVDAVLRGSFHEVLN